MRKLLSTRYTYYKDFYENDNSKRYRAQGIDENGKLILTDFEQGAWDVLGRFMTVHGDIFISKETAKTFLNELKKN
jgi:hypothetical protein